jgi:sugar O-acyltransferase (sialic acid O-acetyltransferase NeuD family)
VIEESGRFEVAGLVGSDAEVGRRVMSYEVLGTDEDLPALLGRCGRAIVAVGQIKTPDVRIRLFERLRELGFELPVVVSPHAHVARSAKLGAGTIVMHGAIVNADAMIGCNCIINTRALVEHGVRIEDHCHIATGAIVNGGVTIGAGTFIGSGATVREGITIGERRVIGMAQSTRKDL